MTVTRHKQSRIPLRQFFILTLVCAMILSLSGCSDEADDTASVTKYKVDYNGEKEYYGNAADEYPAGYEVEVYYPYIATDTDYHFYLNGEPLNTSYDDQKGFVIRFTMPEHDVSLKCEIKNSMVEDPPTEPEGADIMLIDYYHSTVATDGGDGYDEITLISCTADQVRMIVYHQQGDENETSTEYIVPYEVVDRCYNAIDRYGFREWDQLEDAETVDGAQVICKFRDGNGYIRVSSDKMPEDGVEKMDAVASIMREYEKDEYLAAQ